MAAELWAIVLVLGGCAVGSFGPIFLKKSADSFSLNLVKIIRNKNLMIGLFFYGLGTVAFIPALKGVDLSVLYPLVATSYIFVSFYSIWLLKEKMNLGKWLGVFIIILGVVLIGLGS